MKIYFAGNTGIDRIKLLTSMQCSKLVSYYAIELNASSGEWLREREQFDLYYKFTEKTNEKNL